MRCFWLIPLLAVIGCRSAGGERAEPVAEDAPSTRPAMRPPSQPLPLPAPEPTLRTTETPLDTSALPASAFTAEPVKAGTPPLVWQCNGTASARVVDAGGTVVHSGPVQSGDLIVVSRQSIRIGESRSDVKADPATTYRIYLDINEDNTSRQTRGTP